MQSIGNDIVDLRLIDADRSKQPRFYSKILAPSEVALYQYFSDVLPFALYVWLCWSVKEAAYKYSKRLDPELLFSPPRTVISDLDISIRQADETVYAGKCVSGFASVYFQTIQRSGYIHTVVSSSPFFDEIDTRVFEVDPSESSSQTHQMLIKHVAKIYPDTSAELMKDEHNIPTLLVDSSRQLVSIAHHGCYGSFALDAHY